MKILIITTEFHPFPGGIATYAYNMAYYAEKMNYNTTVICPDYNIKNDEYKFDTIKYNSNNFKSSDILKLMYKTFKTLNANNFDFIHACDWPAAFALYLYSKYKKINYGITIHGTDISIYKNARLFKFINKNKLFNSANKIFTNSNFTKSLFLNTFPNIKTSIATTYLGVHEDFKKNNIDISDINIRNKYNISNKKIILSVSRIDKRKGHLDAIEALNKLDKKLHEDIIYVVIGKKSDEEYLELLKKTIKESSVECIYLSQVSFKELLAFYDESIIFLMPGKPDTHKVEGFGLVYAEAATRALPVIAYALSAVPEVVKDKETGLLSKVNDILQLTKNIEILISNDKYRNDLSQKALKYSEKFSWENCVKETYK